MEDILTIILCPSCRQSDSCTNTPILSSSPSSSHLFKHHCQILDFLSFLILCQSFQKFPNASRFFSSLITSNSCALHYLCFRYHAIPDCGRLFPIFAIPPCSPLLLVPKFSIKRFTVLVLVILLFLILYPFFPDSPTPSLSPFLLVLTHHQFR